MTLGLIIFLALLLLPFLWAVGAYNRLVTLRNAFKNAFAQIDVQLKRRYDLIPNLVETAKAYMAHERTTLEAVIAARNSAASARQAAAANPGEAAALNQMATAETALSGMLTKFFALTEAYPDLKANQNMLQLTEELSSTENKISFARQAYNDAVMVYNTAIEQFPTGIIASTFNFKAAELLQATEAEEERKPVKVAF